MNISSFPLATRFFLSIAWSLTSWNSSWMTSLSFPLRSCWGSDWLLKKKTITHTHTVYTCTSVETKTCTDLWTSSHTIIDIIHAPLHWCMRIQHTTIGPALSHVTLKCVMQLSCLIFSCRQTNCLTCLIWSRHCWICKKLNIKVSAGPRVYEMHKFYAVMYFFAVMHYI